MSNSGTAVATSGVAFKRARRVAAGVAVSAVFGALAVTSPAYAEPATGICNGVVNQLAHRGPVQENLLKAAARKNARLITKREEGR